MYRDIFKVSPRTCWHVRPGRLATLECRFKKKTHHHLGGRRERALACTYAPGAKLYSSIASIEQRTTTHTKQYTTQSFGQECHCRRPTVCVCVRACVCASSLVCVVCVRASSLDQYSDPASELVRCEVCMNVCMYVGVCVSVCVFSSCSDQK